jgi:PAS domain S-box-containing protein
LAQLLTRLKGFIAHTPHVAVHGLDQHGVIQFWDLASTHLYGINASEAIGQRLQDLLLDTDAAQVLTQVLREVWETGRASSPHERVVRSHTGEKHWLYSTVCPVIKRGRVVELLGVDIDITARKQVEETWRQTHEQLERRIAVDTVTLQETSMQLQAAVSERERMEEALRSSQDQLWALATRLQGLQEEERRRIARDIHDEMAQGLTSLKIDVSWLSKHLVSGQVDLQERLAAMTTQLDMLFDAVQRIGTALRPYILDHLGLLAAIEWQLQDMRRRTGLRYTLTLPQQDIHLESARATALFRIFQEALNNVLRHAAATRVTVRVAQWASGIRLSVSDNGKGIHPEQLQDLDTLGLVGMHERAQLWNGNVTVQNRRGGGTTVTVWMPYEQAKEA